MGFLDFLKYDTIDSTNAVGNSVQRRKNTAISDNYTKNQKETEIETINRELQSIDNDLDAAYMQIGRRFMEKAAKTQDLCGLEIQDILRIMQPKAARKKELEKRIAMIEKEVREINFLRDKEQAELEFQDEKAKLDKALSMDILNQREYEQRLNAARRKADNFEEIRRINQQYEIKLISAEERDAKIRKLLEE